MIAAVTGGTGFIGRRLVAELLARGYSVRVLSRVPPHPPPTGVTVYQGDLADPAVDLSSFLRKAEVLFHCAAEVRNRERMESVNVRGTERLIQAARGIISRWIQLSSVGVYGPARSGVVDEDRPLRPVGTYEVTKARSDELVAQGAAAGYFEAAVLRPSIVYGEAMPNRSLFSMIQAIDRGFFFFIGPPGASANYIYVDNVVDALLLCTSRTRERYSVYNLSDHMTVEALVGTVARALGKETPRLRLPAVLLRGPAGMISKLWPGCPLTPSRINALTTRSSYSIDRIRRELGYDHRVSMAEGFQRLVRHWRCRCSS